MWGGVLPHFLWFAQLLAFLFLAGALLSFNPGDWPSPLQDPHNDPTRNWCGGVGAWPAYKLFSLLGWGTWPLMALWGLYLFVTAAITRVTHVPVRLLGTLVVAVAVSGFHSLLMPTFGALAPSQGGGMIGTWLAAKLAAPFNTLGAILGLTLVLAVGLVVAIDVWVVIAPAWAFRKAKELSPPVIEVTSTVAGAVAGTTATASKKGFGFLWSILTRPDPADDSPLLPKRLRRKLAGEEPGATMPDEMTGSAVASSAINARKGKKLAEAKEEIDEMAGGLGATEAFDPKKFTLKGGVPVVDSRSDQAATDDDDADTAEAGEAEEAAAVANVKKSFTPEELRAKIAKLPLFLAGADKKVATEDDLRDIQTMGDMEGYKFPGVDQLEEPEVNFSKTMEAYVRDQASLLERALKEYRINGEVVGIQSGPVITNYEIKLAPGTKVSALSAVSSDLARSLKAVNVRIVSNTAGRDTVGVEVPNSTKEKVRLKELMGRSDVYATMNLPMFLGKDASGNPLIADLTKMPHMLIAGTTGSGKSVCMNSILMSFMYTKKPNELKLVLVDPKMVELSQFKDIPHLMCPVVTEMSKAAAILEWAVRKMDERYELLAEAGCTNITAYNALTWEELKDRMNPSDENEAARIPKKLPYMVFVIDELADLMMTNKEVETSIIRLAQKARAVGMHLILATQRPQANVVTGLIKSNMPSRIAFKVNSGMDSRIVMDHKGAELLLGQGDMLFLSPRSSELTRAQGTLVDDLEIRRVVKFLKEVAAPTYERSLLQIKTGAAAAGSLGGEDDADGEITHDGYKVAQQDELFERAVDIVMETNIGSVSMLQRRLAIGYTRSARLIELMGHAGILGQHKGTQAREVLVSAEEWAAMKAQIAADAAQSGGAPAGETGDMFVAKQAETKLGQPASFGPTPDQMLKVSKEEQLAGKYANGDKVEPARIEVPKAKTAQAAGVEAAPFDDN